MLTHLLIFVAVSAIEMIFVQQCFIYTVCAASDLKGVVVNLVSSGMSWVTNVCVQNSPVCTDLFKSYTTMTVRYDRQLRQTVYIYSMRTKQKYRSEITSRHFVREQQLTTYGKK